MKKTAMVISGTVLILGCLTLAVTLLLSAVLPNAFLVYLTANPASFSHEILTPDMTGPYIFSVITIIIGLAGVLFYAIKAKD